MQRGPTDSTIHLSNPWNQDRRSDLLSIPSETSRVYEDNPLKRSNLNEYFRVVGYTCFRLYNYKVVEHRVL